MDGIFSRTTNERVTHMLVLTEAAAEVVKAMTSTPEAPQGSGLRIASATAETAEPGTLQVSAATGPGQGDQVIEAAGAHVYLEPQAAAYLEDKVLDAQVDTEGKAHFSLGLQGPEQA
jgi:iron-sulfur cluster assembly protein